jgi:type IV secretion system protein VirD4
MDLFERALGFIGGYGLKAYIMVQGLPQLFKAYGKDVRPDRAWSEAA